jgi:hypothetical protein
MNTYVTWVTGIATLIIALGLTSVLFFDSIFMMKWIVTFGVTLYVVSIIPSLVSNDSTQNSTERVKVLFKQLEVICILIAAVGGLFALDIYQATNVLAVRNSLETRDAQTRQNYYNKDGGRLMQIFVNDPGDEVIDDASCKQVQDKINPWSRSAILSVVDPKHRNKLPQWGSLHDLYDSLFDTSTGSTPGMYDIKRGLFHMVDLVYIIYDAYAAKEQHIFNNDEYAMWEAYIEDLGTSPFFLMVIMDGHEYGYQTKDFSKEIWRHYSKKKNPRLHCFAQVLYPKLAVESEEEWMKEWGKLRVKGTRIAKDNRAQKAAVQ